MSFFTYPLDTKTLLRKKIKLRKELLSSSAAFTEKKNCCPRWFDDE